MGKGGNITLKLHTFLLFNFVTPCALLLADGSHSRSRIGLNWPPLRVMSAKLPFRSFTQAMQCQAPLGP